MQKFSIYCLLLFFAFTAIAQEKTSIDVQLTLQNQTGSPYFCDGSRMTLIATPNEPGLSYQWFLDGSLVETTTTNMLPVRSAGNYSVKVSNSQVSGTSSKLSVNACPDNSAEIAAIWAQSLKDGKGKPPKETQSAFTATISSVNPILCNGNTSATLTAQPQGPQYTYQWQYASCFNCTYTNQSGQTGNSLTTTTTGFYKVLVTENGTTMTANPFRVASVPYATLTDQSDNPSGIVTVTPGQSTSLKVNFTGTGPFYFSYNDGTGDKTVSNITSNPYTLAVTPDQNRRYKLNSVGSNLCGSTNSDLVGSVRVVVDASTSVTLPTPTNLNVCAGSTIEIPYETVGTWAGARNLSIQLISEAEGYAVNTQFGQSTGPLRITIPGYYSPFSQYRIGVLPVLPASVAGPVISSYILTVTSVGCLAKPIVSASPGNQVCSSVYISSTNPVNNGTSNYQWFRNGIAIPSMTSSGFYAYESGDYYVKVTNASANYIDSSAVQTITVLTSPITITSPNSVLCGNNTTAVLTASTSTPGGTWQWYKSNVAISGATNAIYTATTTGEYRAEYTGGNCTTAGSIYVADYPSAVFTTLSGSSSQTISPGTSTQLKAVFTGEGPWTFQLYDGSNYKNMSASANPHLITVQPEQNRYYSLSSIKANNCSYTSGVGSVRVSVNPSTSFTLSSPTNFNVCAGGTIEIPYTTAGTWTNDRKLYVQLYDANNNYISNSYQGYFSDNPIRYTLPSTLSLNSVVRLSVFSDLPSSTSSTNSYQLTVANTGCQPTATIRNGNASVQCGSVSLNAYPQGLGYTYQWFLNGNAVAGATNSYYSAIQTGAYTVQVNNSSTSYSSTSPATNVTVTMPAISVTPNNTALCNGGTVTLNASISDVATYNYQWNYVSFNGGNYTPIPGADQPNYVAATAGYYQVSISPKSGNCSVTSPNVSVLNAGAATLTNMDGNNSNVLISPGQTAQLKVTFTGQPPFTFKYYDETYEKRVSTNASEYILNVTPTGNRNYYLTSYGNACGNGNTSGYVTVLVNGAVSLSLPTPANLTACAGGSIEIPYTTIGSWETNRKLSVMMTYSMNGVTYSASNFLSSTASPLTVRVPSSFPIGTTVQVSVGGVIPYFNTVYPNYNLTVTASGCIPTPQIYEQFSRQCGSVSLYTESLSGYSYQWYRDGNSTGNTSSGYTATVNGTYTVRVTGSNGFDVTSAPRLVTVGNVPIPVISKTGSNDCNSGGSFTLTSDVNNPDFSYQWYYASSSDGPFLPVAGGTSSSLNTANHGLYFVVVESGSCQSTSSQIATCPIIVQFSSTSVCQNGSVTVNYSINQSYSSNTVFALSLVDAVSGNPIISSLATLTGGAQSFTNVTIPLSVSPGTYRFVVSSSNPGYKSSMSAGVLTVTTTVAPAAPTLTAVPSAVAPGESSTLTASGCNGTVRWSNSSTSSATRIVTPSGTTTYYAVCIDANGCTTASGSVTVIVNCDNLEPNNTYQSATLTNTTNYLSPQVCLDSGTDEDWYTYIYNNQVYYIKVSLYSTTSNTGYYKLSIGVINDSLRVETLSSSNSSIDTYLRLYSSDGITLLGYDDDSGVNAFSLLKYKLPSPCPSILSLYSTLLDIFPGQTNTAKALQINATNKIGDGATANYYGQNAVLLSPGFQTNLSTGGSFNAAIQGCN